MAVCYWKNTSGGAQLFSSAAYWYTDAACTLAKGSAPTTGDDIVFNSNGGSDPCTWGTNISISSLNCTGYAGTITHASSVTITVTSSGASTGVILASWSRASATASYLAFTTNSCNFNPNGQQLGPVTINGAGITVTLTGTFTQSSTSTLTLTNGKLDLNGNNCTIGLFSSNNTNTRELDYSGCTLTIIGTTTGWATTNATGLTLTGTSGTIAFNTGAAPLMNSGGCSFPGTVTVDSAAFEIRGAATFVNLTMTGTAAITNVFEFPSNTTVTITGTFTINGNSVVNRPWIRPNSSAGTYGRGITNAIISAATVVTKWCDWESITGAGAANWDLTAQTTNYHGDCGFNSGITFTTPKTCYWIGGTGSWVTAAEWSGSSQPLPQDAVVFNNSSFTAGGQISTISMRCCGSIDATAVTNYTFSLAQSSTAVFIYGSLNLGANGTWTATSGALTFAGMGTGASYSIGFNQAMAVGGTGNITINAPNDTYTLISDVTCVNRALQVAHGTLISDGYDMSIARLLSTYTLTTIETRTIDLSGSAVTVNGLATSSNIINFTDTTGLTWTAPDLLIFNYDIDATAQTPFFGALSWNDITFADTSTAQYQFQNESITGFGTMILGAGTNVLFFSGQTYNIDSFETLGTAVAGCTIASSTGGLTHALKCTSGTCHARYTSITDSAASGGAVWDSSDNCTNVSGNTGWQWMFLTYTIPSELPMALVENALASIDFDMSFFVNRLSVGASVYLPDCYYDMNFILAANLTMLAGYIVPDVLPETFVDIGSALPLTFVQPAPLDITGDANVYPPCLRLGDVKNGLEIRENGKLYYNVNNILLEL